MTSEYDQTTAFHYAAYRPALHLPILSTCIDENAAYLQGLDVGCGVGHSAIALANFCNKVIGAEPSKEMLQKSIAHPKVAYRYFNKTRFDFPADSFDVTTFAGSLFYAKSQQLLDETIRVNKHASKIVIYDFEILLNPIFELLEINIPDSDHSNYDHQINFDGLNQEHIKLEMEYKKGLSADISIDNISHILLSSKDNFHLLIASLGIENIYNKVTQKLREAVNSENAQMEAMTYATVYRVVK